MRGNYTALRLYNDTVTQRRFTYGVKIGMDLPAIIAYARTMRMPCLPVLMSKMIVLERLEMKQEAEKRGPSGNKHTHPGGR